jgi:hypothetical protein
VTPICRETAGIICAIIPSTNWIMALFGFATDRTAESPKFMPNRRASSLICSPNDDLRKSLMVDSYTKAELRKTMVKKGEKGDKFIFLLYNSVDSSLF